MSEKLNPIYEKKKKRSRALKIFGVTVSVVLILAAVYFFVFHLEEVTYSGNKYYSEEELNEMLLSDGMSGNSLYVLVKFGLIFNPDYPYIEKVDVRMVSPSHLHIDVTEKVVVGCVERDGSYMYFDTEGLVIDQSSQQFSGVPLIEGITFDRVEMGEKLSLENERLLERVLNISVMLTKYKLKSDKVFFDEDGKITVYLGSIRAELGKDTNLKLKLVDLPRILPSLAGKAGVLHMENYSVDSDSITFTEDKEPEKPSSAAAPESSSGEPSSGEPESSSAAPSQQGENPSSAAPASSAPASSQAPSSAAPSGTAVPSFAV